MGETGKSNSLPGLRTMLGIGGGKVEVDPKFLVWAMGRLRARLFEIARRRGGVGGIIEDSERGKSHGLVIFARAKYRGNPVSGFEPKPFPLRLLNLTTNAHDDPAHVLLQMMPIFTAIHALFLSLSFLRAGVLDMFTLTGSRRLNLALLLLLAIPAVHGELYVRWVLLRLLACWRWRFPRSRSLKKDNFAMAANHAR
jgi:hypothetical protein